MKSIVICFCANAPIAMELLESAGSGRLAGVIAQGVSGGMRRSG